MAIQPLIDVNDSVLIVIDIQPDFTVKLTPADRQALLERACWLIGVANWLTVPLVVTVEDLAQAGSAAPEVLQALPPDTPIFDKLIFGLADQPDILDAVERTGRRTAILIGLETDVCVSHSALGLMERGFRVVVVADATGSPGDSHSAGLARMREAGVTITTVKGLYYEWVRTVEKANRYYVECASLKRPAGIIF